MKNLYHEVRKSGEAYALSTGYYIQSDNNFADIVCAINRGDLSK